MTKMLPRMNLLGQRFGKLNVSEYLGKNKSGASTWLCLCDCGGQTKAHTGELRAGKRNACACGLSKPKHGMCDTRLYCIWTAMKSRCQNPKKLAYASYGGRGITVCDEWQRFIPFMEWALTNGYRDDLECDRINNDGPYAPDNCRWVTRTENQRNKRPAKPLGLRYTVRELRFACQRAGIKPDTLFAHLPKKRIYR
jgi:hypothetical protein